MMKSKLYDVGLLGFTGLSQSYDVDLFNFMMKCEVNWALRCGLQLNLLQKYDERPCDEVNLACDEGLCIIL